MGKHRERHAEERRKTQVEFKRSEVLVADQKSVNAEGEAVCPSADPQPHKEGEPVDSASVDLKGYITEIPLPIEEKTSIIRQFLSGVERLFSIVGASFKRAIMWITRRGPGCEERV